VARWSWSVGPWKAGVSALADLAGRGGAPEAELTEATSRSLKLKLLDPHEASFNTSGYSAEALRLEDLITDLWVYRDGTNLFRGRVANIGDQLDIAAYDLTVACRDYREVLLRRLLQADRTWTSVEQSTIAWNLIQDTQALDGGNLGIVQGAWPTTGVVRPSVTFTAGDTVWESIKKLGQMANGFDFDIDADLQANLYYPQRGSDVGAVLDYGGIVTQMTRAWDPAQFANAIRQSGADGVTPVITSVPGLAAAPEGRWEAQYSDTQLTTADMVAQTAATNLARASMPVPTYTVTLAPDAWGGPSHFWLGDYVTFAVKAGRLNEVVKVRVFEIDVSLDDNDVETVNVVIGDVALDARSVLRGIARRLNVLAKR